PEANSSDPNALGWLKRAPNTPWSSPGATGDGTDVIPGKSFALPGTGTFTSSGDVDVTANLDLAVVPSRIANPARNNGGILTTALPAHHMDYIQPQRHTSGSNSQPLSYRPQLSITVTPGNGNPPPDTTPPTVTITSAPPATTASTTASFSFTGTDNITPANGPVYQAPLDGAPSATVTSPVTFSNLSPGSHTFQVKDFDQAGNVSAVASATFTVSPVPAPPPADGAVYVIGQDNQVYALK